MFGAPDSFYGSQEGHPSWREARRGLRQAAGCLSLMSWLSVELDQSAVSTAKPGISVRRKSSSLGSRHVSGSVQIQYPFSRVCRLRRVPGPRPALGVTNLGALLRLIAGRAPSRVVLDASVFRHDRRFL
jgi:hypothetical protein